MRTRTIVILVLLLCEPVLAAIDPNWPSYIDPNFVSNQVAGGALPAKLLRPYFATAVGLVGTNHSIKTVATDYSIYPSSLGMECNFTSASFDANVCYSLAMLTATNGVSGKLTIQARITPSPTYSFATGRAVHVFSVLDSNGYQILGVWIRNESGILNAYAGMGTTARTAGTWVGRFRDTNMTGVSGDAAYLSSRVTVGRNEANGWHAWVDTQQPVFVRMDKTPIKYLQIGKPVASGDSTLRAAITIASLQAGRFWIAQEGLHFPNRVLPTVNLMMEAAGAGAALPGVNATTGGGPPPFFQMGVEWTLGGMLVVMLLAGVVGVWRKRGEREGRAR